MKLGMGIFNRWKIGIILLFVMTMPFACGVAEAGEEQNKGSQKAAKKQGLEIEAPGAGGAGGKTDARQAGNDKYVEVGVTSYHGTLAADRQWQATAYEALDKGNLYPDNPPAKICFWREASKENRQCALARDGSVDYPVVEGLKTILLRKKPVPLYGIVFKTRVSDPTLGQTRLVSVWALQKQSGQLMNILQGVTLSDVSEFRIDPGLGNKHEAMIFTADRVWKDGTLYGGRHRFIIRVYRYSAIKQQYDIADEYETKKKYLVNDIGENDYGVIRNELTHMMYRLQGKR